jgi:FKBP-type peptidyl-prolyl cis-trans isomerase FklB
MNWRTLRTMKKHTRGIPLLTCSIATLFGATALVNAQSPPPADAATPAPVPASVGPTPQLSDAAGYAYGVNFGQQLNRLGITTEIPIDSITRGLKDGIAGKKTTPGDLEIVSEFVKYVNAGIVARNRAAAKEFLDHEAAEKGVKKTRSGLEYKIIAAGNTKAASPQLTDVVTVQYRGRLIDGTEFDNSYSRKTPPPVFAMSGVIKGWQEALAMMKPGAKWQLFVPPELGYDAKIEQGIPPGSLLIFDVELLSVAAPPGIQPAAGTSMPRTTTSASAQH